MFLRQIKIILSVNGSKGTIDKGIKDFKNFVLKHISCKPRLISHHNQARMNWTQKYIDGDKLLSVLLRNERNVDGFNG